MSAAKLLAAQAKRFRELRDSALRIRCDHVTQGHYVAGLLDADIGSPFGGGSSAAKACEDLETKIEERRL